jgi:hypothetical protein
MDGWFFAILEAQVQICHSISVRRNLRAREADYISIFILKTKTRK